MKMKNKIGSVFAFNLLGLISVFFFLPLSKIYAAAGDKKDCFYKSTYADKTFDNKKIGNNVKASSCTDRCNSEANSHSCPTNGYTPETKDLVSGQCYWGGPKSVTGNKTCSQAASPTFSCPTFGQLASETDLRTLLVGFPEWSPVFMPFETFPGSTTLTLFTSGSYEPLCESTDKAGCLYKSSNDTSVGASLEIIRVCKSCRVQGSDFYCAP